MKKITITLDEETAAWARVYAAGRDMSLSRMVGEMLHQRMRHNSEYDRSMRLFLARKPTRLEQRRARYPSRDDLHDRKRVR
jgi:hypothetical protein